MKILKQIQPFVSRHWFKLCVVAFLVFLFLQKELSFHLQMTAPVRQESPPQAPPPPPLSDQNTVLTEQVDNTPTVTDRLQIFGGSQHTNSRSAKDRLQEVDFSVIQAFVKRFAHVAETEQDKYGVPASIILASGLLHSQAGTYALAQQRHNYFSLACTKNWSGPKEEVADKCYRVYKNAWSSFRDHSLYLTTGAMSYMKQHAGQDYRKWAKELEKTGMSPEKSLDKQLIGVIEQYELYQFD